jgi:AcrR family transcriptional regulator
MAKNEARKTSPKKGHPIESKDRIVDAALSIFISEGAAFTRLNEVAKVAKVPAPLIHYYFKNVEDLHYEVILRVQYDLYDFNVKAAERETQPTLKKMEIYLNGPLLWASKRPDYFNIWLYFYYMASRSVRFSELYEQLMLRGRERISLMVYQGIEAGHYHLSVGQTVQQVAQSIQALINGYLISFGLEKQGASCLFYQDQLRQSVFKMLGVGKEAKVDSVK